jgi:formylglycine-generating enzyme required for sulfatase activity
MARNEKTVFISYRREDVSWALLVYQYLAGQKYDVFFDFSSLPSGDFEQVIISNIKARTHFVLILTPTTLNRCDQPGDWVRREIETAIDQRRNIIPLFFDDFNFGLPSVTEKLTGKLANIKRYNGLEVPPGFFMEAMERLCERYLNVPFSAVIHPISNEIQRVVKEVQVAANKALSEQKIDLEPIKEKTPVRRSYGIGVGLLLTAALCIFGGISLIQYLNNNETPTPTYAVEPLPTEELTSEPTIPVIVDPINTEPPIPPTAVTLDPENIMISPKDNMPLVLVPAGDFTMGTTGNEADERPVHTVYLDDFLIDKTEVTNAMYALCVSDGKCEPPRVNTSITQNASNGSFYYGNPVFDNYPVIFVTWNDAKAYCRWAGRRLPIEAEWEKAASWDDGKKEKRLYPWGNKIDCSYANYYGNGANLCVGDTTAVGSFPTGASFYGILDMAGNVWEWVADRYDPEYYGKSDSHNPTGPGSGDYIVIRGGSFLTGRAVGIRSSDREIILPDNASHSVGFRCAADAP